MQLFTEKYAFAYRVKHPSSTHYLHQIVKKANPT